MKSDTDRAVNGTQATCPVGPRMRWTSISLRGIHLPDETRVDSEMTCERWMPAHRQGGDGRTPSAKRVRHPCGEIGAQRVPYDLPHPGRAAACFIHFAICTSSRSSSWTSIQRASLLMPPDGTGSKDVRYLDIHEDDQLDEAQMATWVTQAAAVPG